MDRVTPPSFKKSLTFSLPSPERFLLPGDVELIYLPSSLSQAIKIEFVFRAGRIYEPGLGVAQFVSQLIDKGVPGKNAGQIAALFDYYGAHIESQAGFDFTSVSLYCLKKDVRHLLPLFIELLTEATFPEEELETYRRIFVENLKINLKKNSFLASNEIRKSLFGNHPYGLSVSVSDAEKIDNQMLKSFFDTHFSPFKIFVVGTIEEKDFDLLKRFEYRGPLSSSAPPFITTSSSVNHLDIDGPNKTQASIRLGISTITRKHSDIGALTLTNHILGGFFGSRLMKNIREEKGLTYGIHSGIQHLNQASWLTISADVNADRVEEAIVEIKKELDLLSIFNDSAELELCKNHLIGSIQNDTATIFSVGERLKTMSLNELEQTYYNNLILSIDSATVNDIQRISSRYLSTQKIITIEVK